MLVYLALFSGNDRVLGFRILDASKNKREKDGGGGICEWTHWGTAFKIVFISCRLSGFCKVLLSMYLLVLVPSIDISTGPYDRLKGKHET